MAVDCVYGQIVLTKDSCAEVIFNKSFLKGEHRVCQIDFLSDLISDLTLLHDTMITENIDAIEGIKRISGNDSANFVEMRGMIKKYKSNS